MHDGPPQPASRFSPSPSLKPFYSRFVLLSVPGSSCFPLRRRHPLLRRLSRGNALVIRIESALTFAIEPFGRKERALRDRWAILGLEESKESVDREAKHRARLYCAYIAGDNENKSERTDASWKRRRVVRMQTRFVFLSSFSFAIISSVESVYASTLGKRRPLQKRAHGIPFRLFHDLIRIE